MPIKREHLEGIKAGRISLAFRRWQRPTVRAGGKLRTAVGELAIDAVDVVTPGEITDIDARHAGFSSRDELIAELHKRQDGSLYRVRLLRGFGPASSTPAKSQSSSRRIQPDRPHTAASRLEQPVWLVDDSGAAKHRRPSWHAGREPRDLHRC